MAFENWEKDESGNLKLYPLSGWDSFVPFGMMCGLRVEYVRSPAMLLSGERLHLPLVMTPSQARELAAALTRLADKAEAPASPEETGH